MGDEKYNIDNDPAVRAAIEAEREKITRRKATSIVPFDAERKRCKRNPGGGNKTRGGRPQWPDVTEHGTPKKTCANARVAIEALGVSCRYDEFHDQVTIALMPVGKSLLPYESTAMEHLPGANMDHAGHLLRVAMHAAFDFDPGKDHVHDALIQLALIRRFDPIRDFLDGLQWDRRPRLDTWLSTYLSAEDTPLNSWFGKLTLVAAVRRVRQPGCKFDHILVLEGEEGTMKSSAIELLALDPKNFSDQRILGLSDREQQELLRGKWLYEISEMQGMKRAEVEHVKAFASRTHDRARPAYGRSVNDQPRRCILIGTTNADTYLKSQTGNRRFWPVKTGTINLDAMRRDRDQLWAEAAAVEVAALSLELPREHWPQAKIEQDGRLEHDPWIDLLEKIEGPKYSVWQGEGQEYRVSTDAIFDEWLSIPQRKRSTGDAMRLKGVMSRLGWRGPELMYFSVAEKQVRLRGYRRRA